MALWKEGKQFVGGISLYAFYRDRFSPVQVLDLDRKGNSSLEERELVLEEIYRELRGYIDK